MRHGLQIRANRGEEKGFSSYERFAIEYDLSRMHYWKIEKGLANITIRTLINILNIHQITLEEFFNPTN